MAAVDSTEKAFSNRWREGAEEILSQEKPVKMPEGLDQESTRTNPTKEEYQKRAIDAGKFIAEMTPIIGDAMAAKEVYDEIQREDTNWLYVGALGGAAVIGLIPGLGDAAAKLIKKGAEKALDIGKRVEVDPNALGSTGGNLRLKPKEEPPLMMSNKEYDARIAELDKAETVKEWQTNARKLVTSGRVADPVVRTPELEESAKKLIDGKITRKQHLEKVDEFKPVGAWDDLPREPSDKAVVFALNNEQREMGNFILPNAKKLNVKKSNIKIGDRFLGRLDIPAYKAYDTWIITGVTPKGDKGSTYAKAIHYTIREDKPVIFKATQAKGEKIGVGEEGKVGYATIDGNVKDLDVDAIRAKALKYLNDPEWTQVGFDPRRQAGFYVRAGKNKHVPVREATEVIQIGPLILAKNAKLDFDHKGYNKGGMMEQQMSLFEEGGMKDDGLKKDPVSGNDIPPGSLAKEVRDDIPAQLSDGEYVVPADVVQYYGVKFFEDLRMEAKRGLEEMDATGRIGGEPVSMTMIAVGEAEKEKKALGGPVGYANGGVSDDMQQIEKSRTFNPADYAVLGFTPVSPVAQTGQTSQQGVTRTVTYYHGETGESRVVTFVGGVVTPPTDLQYTQPPWSTNKPSPTKVEEKKQERDDSKDPEFISTSALASDPAFKDMNAKAILDKNGNVMTMTKQGYGAVLTSANRLGLDINEYYNLPMSTKAKLVGQELKSAFGGKIDESRVDKIIADAAEAGPTLFDRLISFGKSLFGIDDTETSITTPPSGKPTSSGAIEESTTPLSRPDNLGGSDDDKPSFIKGMTTADRLSAKPKTKAETFREQERSRMQGTAGTQEKGIPDASGNIVPFNKGGLINKPKRTPKKPRGKGLGNRK